MAGAYQVLLMAGVYQVLLMAAQTGKGEHAVVFKKSLVSRHAVLVGRIASGIMFNLQTPNVNYS